MNSRKPTKEMNNGKTNPIYKQMKCCFQDLDLLIHSEEGFRGELGIHARLDTMDVGAGLTVLYNTRTGMITLHALHFELTEDEWDAVQYLIPMMHQQFEVVEPCHCLGTTVIGCTATLSVEGGTLDVQYFRKVLFEAVEFSNSISWFVCGLRDRCEEYPERVPIENLN